MLETLIQDINALAWGLPMLILLLGTGIYLTLGLGFMTLRRVPRAVSLLFSGVSGRGEGDIAPFKALMTSLSATIGTGNIAGVATAGGCRPGSAEAPVTPLDLAYLNALGDDLRLARRWGQKIWPA